MKVLIKLKYQLLLIPLAYVFTCVFATINYMYWGEKLKAIKMLFIGLIISIICYDFIPEIATKFNLERIFFDSPIYFFLTSVIASIYFINNQNEYIKQHNREDK